MKNQKTKNRHQSLPAPERRGLNREEAATFIGVGPSKFDTLVSDNRMPKPKKIDGRSVWDVRALDHFFDLLPGGEDLDHNPWDE